MSPSHEFIPIMDNQSKWNDGFYKNDTTASGHGVPTIDIKMSIIQTIYDTSIPIICFVGFMGNGMAVVLIQTNRTLRHFQSNVFLSALAVCSCIFLTTLLCLWVEPYTPDWKLYSSHLGCKLLTYCAHSSDFTCVWFIVIVCVDRLAVLQWSEFRNKTYAKISPQAMILWMVLLICAGHTWVLFLAEPINFYGTMSCAANSKNFKLYSFFNILETIFGILIPTVIIIFTNAIIVWKLVVYHKNNILMYTPTVRFSEIPQQVTTERSRLLSPSTDSPFRTRLNTRCAPKRDHSSQELHSTSEKLSLDAENQQDENSSLCSQLQFITFISTTPNPSTTETTQPIMKTSEFKLIRAILVLTTVFVLMNLPSYMCRLFLSSTFGTGKWHAWLWLVSYLLYYSHHSILFYIYIFNSEQMRKELFPAALKLLECYCLKTVPEFGHQWESNHENL